MPGSSTGGAVASDRAGLPSAAADNEAARFRSLRGVGQVAEPVMIRIPAIAVSSSLQRLPKQPDGSIFTPTRWEQAGWYADGPRPGEPGPAVVLGHVDSDTGPAVFYRLDQLRPGAEVFLDRADGTTARFGVERTDVYPKNDFPAEMVYLPTLTPELRLITCTGGFDRASGHYRDNLIVTARLAS